jgi:hypothetical protein
MQAVNLGRGSRPGRLNSKASNYQIFRHPLLPIFQLAIRTQTSFEFLGASCDTTLWDCPLKPTKHSGILRMSVTKIKIFDLLAAPQNKTFFRPS